MPDTENIISYTALSTYQLLCIREIYNLIDDRCSKAISGWNIESFEKSLVSGTVDDEGRIRALVENDLLALDARKPLKRYLADGDHYAQELFLTAPQMRADDVRPFLLFWAYVAREYSDMALPIDKMQCRAIYMAAIKRFGMRLYSSYDFNIDRFAVPRQGYYSTPLLREEEIRIALFTIIQRNQAYTRRTVYDGGPVYLNAVVERFNEFLESVFPAYAVRLDISIHDICFAIDSYATERQRDYTLFKWGVFTGKPATYAACGRKFGISGARIRACENTVVRNVGHKAKELFVKRKTD